MVNRTQERMWGRKIIKKSSLCGYNYSCCLDTLFCLADKAISSLSIETPLIRSFCSTISEGNLFYTRGDTLPSRDFLGQQGQFTSFARQSLLCPQCQFS